MKTTLDIQHTGSLGDADRHRMGFDENSVTQLMGVLTDLYSNKPAAVTREYITNAIDSHRAAGNTAPVEIDRPNSLNPTFTVRDFGVGMSVEQIITQYAKYGFSSKRDSDEQTGMLGLGCKSGLTYTSQFTVTARQNGREAVVLVTRDADGCGVVQIINEGPTDKPNGVEIAIPVRNVYDFNYVIDNFVRFLDPGVCLVDGEPFPTVWESKLYRHLDDDVLLAPRGENLLVMGGVAYPITDDYLAFKTNDRYYNQELAGVVARVPIGTVNFVPSREALHYTKRTKETLATLNEYVHTVGLRVAKADVMSAPNATEALVRATTWKPMVGAMDPRYSQRRGSLRNPFEWGGEPVPLTDSYTLPDHVKMFTWLSYNGTNSVTEANTRIIPINPNDRGEGVVLVTGFNASLVSKQCKQRLRLWSNANLSPGDQHTKFYLYSDDTIPLPWWDGVKTIPFDEITSIALPKAERKPKKETEEFNFVNRHGGYYPAVITPEMAKERMLISTTAQPSRLADEYGTLFETYAGVPVVRVTLPALAKFMAKFPKAERVEDAIKRDAEAFVAGVTEAEWFMFRKNEEVQGQSILQLKPSDVLDPDLKNLIEKFSTARADIWVLVHSWARLYRAVNWQEDLTRAYLKGEPDDLGLSRLEKRYPLVNHVTTSRYGKRHGLYVSERTMKKMLTRYVNDTYIITEQRKAARKAYIASIGLIGRRRITRRKASSRRAGVAYLVLRERLVRAGYYEGQRSKMERKAASRARVRAVEAEMRRMEAEREARIAKVKAANEERKRKAVLLEIAALMTAMPTPPKYPLRAGALLPPLNLPALLVRNP